MINPNYITHLDHIVRIIIVCTKAVNILSKSEPSPNRSPAKRVRFGNEETVRPAYEKSPKAFLIALGLFLSCIKALNILSSTAVSEGKGVCEKTVRVFPHDLNNPAAAARFCHRQKRENAKRKRQAVPVSFF